MFGWLTHTPPDPVWFTLGGFSVRWYGVLLAAGLLSGVLLAQRLAKRSGIHPERVTDLALVTAGAAIVGARLVHVLDEWGYYRNHLGESVQFWNGGLAFHGVLLGGLLALWAFSRWQKITTFVLLDFCFPALALGQVIGRWGNWLNQELYGAPTALPWGIPIDAAHRAAGYEAVTHFHPLFLYESAGNALVLAVLLLVWRWRGRRLGDVAAVYLILSPLLRFSLDFLRLHQPMIGPLTNAQVFSLPLIAAGIALLATRGRRVTHA